jgi:hypothetical protein
MSLKNFLARGVSGGNLLFCGAGFSVNCLNFSSEEVGVASPLHETLNEALNYNYGDMQIAADEYTEKFGEHKLLSLLTEKYSISKRTKDIDEILKYPWSRIYTTNYDGVISQSLTHLGKTHYCANNTENPKELSRNTTWIVHLHGALQKWDIQNFIGSCVLGRESYLRASASSNWGATLREDYARANAVFFIGFSNSDFYLAEHLFSAEASRDKVFFINSERSSVDRELLAKQKKFGECLAIGKENFAENISEAMSVGREWQLELHSFERCNLPKASEDRASVEQQFAFMVSGKDTPEVHFKEILENSSSYRAPREATQEVVEFLKTDNAIGLIVGGICSGKTLVFDESIMRLQAGGDVVFRLRSKFYDLLSEAKSILKEHPNCILAIDDCFSLKDDIREILTCANSCGARMLLSSRTLAYDSVEDISTLLIKGTPYKVFDTEILNENEGNAIISCTNRIGGWGATASTSAQKHRILERENNSRLSGFLLAIFKSEHIRNRFLSELDSFRTNGIAAEKALILALYLRHIGEGVQENVLSEMLQMDSVGIIKSAGGGGSFISYEPEKNGFSVIASINSRDALKNLFEQKIVIETVVEAITNLETVRYEPSFRHIFSQLMRYTQLKQVIVDFDGQDRFFDRLSEIWFCNNHVLFWLQWSMAMRDHQKFVKANQYLDEAYGRARERDFDTDHLDDQKAGLVLDSISETANSSSYLRCFRESFMLLSKMIKKGSVTSHNYLTINSFDHFFQKAESRLNPAHARIIEGQAQSLRAQVQRQCDQQYQGFVKSSMEGAIISINRGLEILDGIR